VLLQGFLPVPLLFEEYKSVPSGSTIRFLDKQNSMILVQDVTRVVTSIEELHHLLGSAIIG